MHRDANGIPVQFVQGIWFARTQRKIDLRRGNRCARTDVVVSPAR
jgi:hypothetical protein